MELIASILIGYFIAQTLYKIGGWIFRKLTNSESDDYYEATTDLGKR